MYMGSAALDGLLPERRRGAGALKSHTDFPCAGAGPAMHPGARPLVLDLALRSADLRKAHRHPARRHGRARVLHEGAVPLRDLCHPGAVCRQDDLRLRLQPAAVRTGRDALLHGLHVLPPHCHHATGAPAYE